MATRYYEYSKPGSKEKYTEITEAEYLIVKDSTDRWFISFGNCVLECEAHEYDEHYKEKNHSDYINKGANGKKPIIISFDEYRLETGLDLADALVDTTVDVEYEGLDKYQHELLRKALEQLEEDEREIITALFWNQKRQAEVAKDDGTSRQTLHKKQRRILAKVLKIMESKK